VRVGPSTVKLSTGWLGALSGIASIPGALPSVDPTLGRFVLAVGRIVLDKPPGENGTVRAKLGAVDALATREEWRRGAPLSIDWQSSGPAQLVDLLRGPDPEFRDPCRFALLDAFPDPSSHRLLGELVASVVDIPFDDLTPDGFASALAINPEHALETYVELVDRAWALGGLLRRAQEQRPDAAKLRAVSSAYERWDGAVRSRIAEAHGIIVGQWGKQ